MIRLFPCSRIDRLKQAAELMEDKTRSEFYLVDLKFQLKNSELVAVESEYQ